MMSRSYLYLKSLIYQKLVIYVIKLFFATLPCSANISLLFPLKYLLKTFSDRQMLGKSHALPNIRALSIRITTDAHGFERIRTDIR